MRGSADSGKEVDLGLGTLEATLTSACNLACSYCHQRAAPAGVVRWEVLKPWIDRFLASEVEEQTLALTGGEPLLEWPLVCRVIEYVMQPSSRQKGRRVSLTTNGLLLDDEMACFLADYNVEVQISLDGIREAHELRAQGTFYHLDRLLGRLKQNHPSWYRKMLSVGMTLTSANLPFLGRSIEYLLDRGAESIRLAPLLTHDAGWEWEAEAELERQMEVVFDLCLEQHRRTGIMPFELFRRPAIPPVPNPDRPVCRVRTPKALAVGIDGSVSGCPLLLPQEAGGTRSAPVFREWIVNADWPGLRRDRFSSWGQCRNCEIVDECLVCPVASANIPGNTDPRRVPDFNCAFNRIVGRYRRRFPATAGTQDFLKGTDNVPAAMTDLAKALGLA